MSLEHIDGKEYDLHYIQSLAQETGCLNCRVDFDPRDMYWFVFDRNDQLLIWHRFGHCPFYIKA